MNLGQVREVKGYFKPNSKLVDPIKKSLTQLGFDEMEDKTVDKTRTLYFDGTYAKDWGYVMSRLKRKYPKLKMDLSESTDEDQLDFEQFDTTDFETLVLEG